MKLSEEIELLKKSHLSEWISTRSEVFDELSSSQTMVCCCGKLATGLHELSCKKFNKKVDHETTKRLEHLIK